MGIAASFRACCQPVYAEVLRPRIVALSIAAIGAAQVFGSMHGIGIPCAFHQVTGLPCPGCGLTRSCIALLGGHLEDSILLHPLGPPLLLGLVLALAAALLPARGRDQLLSAIAGLERRVGITAIALTLLMVLWVLRVFNLVPLTHV